MLTNAGIWAGTVLLVYSLIMFVQSLSLDYANQLGPGPGFMPLWLSGIMIAATLLYMWESIHKQVVLISEIFPRGGPLQDILLMLGGLCLFALIVTYAGFCVSGSLLIFLMTMRKYKWYYALPAAVAASVMILFIFQSLLGVPLPVNEWGW